MSTEKQSINRPLVVKKREAFRMMGLAPSTAYLLEKTDPTFPKDIELSPGRKGKIVAEIEEWVAQRAAAREVA